MKIDCKINNNKLQIPVNNLWWQNRTIIAVCLLFILLFVSPVYAFEDTVQRYDSDLNELWTGVNQHAGYGSIVSVNVPSVYSTANSIRVHRNNDGSQGEYFAKSDFAFSPSYVGFTLNGLTASQGTTRMKLQYWNASSDALIVEIDIEEANTYKSGNRYEFVQSGTSIFMYIDGVYIRTVASVDCDFVYIGVGVWGSYNHANYYLYFDDFSTSSVIGVNSDWSQANTNIELSYGIQSQSSFPSSEYSLKTYMVSSGSLLNTTSLGSGSSGSESGYVVFNRDTIFGSNFGVYQSILMRDSSVLASKTYSIFDTTVGGAVIFTESVYDQSESESVQVVISSPDFDTYDYAFNFVSSSGSFSQNLVSADTWVDIDFSTVGLGNAYGILSRSGGGSDIEIAFDTVDVVEVAPYLLKFVPSVVYGNSSLNFAWSVGDYVTGYGGESFTLVYNVSGTLSGDPFYSGSHSLKGPFDLSNFGSVGPYYINYLINDSINGSINAYIVQEYSNPVYTSFIIPDSIIHTVIHPAGSNYTEPEPPVVPPWDPGDFPSDNETDVVINDSDLDNLPDIPDFNQSDFNNSALLNGSLNLSGTSTYYSGVSDSVDGFFSTFVGVMSWALSPVVSLTSSVVSFNSVLESSLSSTSSSSDSIFSDIGYIFKNLNSKVNGVILFSLCLIVLLVILGR